MSGTKRFPRYPKMEYLDRTYKKMESTVAHEAPVGLEECSHLANRYQEQIIKDGISGYDELMTGESIKELMDEFLSEEAVHVLMASELGQGIILGYLKASIDWRDATEENPY